MADSKKRLSGNSPGPWFVDGSCINCDVCRQLAPEVFREEGPVSVVARQPVEAGELGRAFMALLACPVAAIGVEGGVKAPEGLFPEEIEGGVFYCGFTSEDSFGANSFFAQRRAGNLLVDSPRWVKPLVREIEKRGGIQDILLTHRDDVADAGRYQKHFGARVWIHEADRRAAPLATDILKGVEPTAIRPDLMAIPVPGHTRGSAAYLLEGRFLFSGDSLYWSRRDQDLGAFRDACWYSWEEQKASLARLAEFPFEWVLAGHGDRARRPAAEMKGRLLGLVRRMSRESDFDSDW